MPISYEELIQGSVFKFFLGAKKQPMTIHTALVADQSPELSRLVGGYLNEAKTETAMLPDVDPDTFTRFAQYVYTGDYPSPTIDMIEDSSAVENNDGIKIEDRALTTKAGKSIEEAGSISVSALVPALEPELEPEAAPEPGPIDVVGSSWESKVRSSKKLKKKSRSVSVRPGFNDLVYTFPISQFQVHPKVPPHNGADQDYTPVFLGHARLYVLAEKWNIESLQALVLHKMHDTLRAYTPYEARYSDLVQLIRFTYEHTGYRKGIDKLRELLILYVAHEQPKIAGSEPCLALVEEGGDFAKDLLSMMAEKVKDSSL